MEVELENTLAMNLFWEVLNEAFQKYTANPTIRFRPYGWMMDEAGAFWSSIAISKEKNISKGLSAVKNILTLLCCDKRRPLLEVK